MPYSIGQLGADAINSAPAEPIGADGRTTMIPGCSTSRHRLNRGRHRQANAALHRVVVGRMRTHQPTLDYVRRRTAEGKSKREIIRCLKRFVAREIFGYLCRVPKPTRPEQISA